MSESIEKSDWILFFYDFLMVIKYRSFFLDSRWNFFSVCNFEGLIPASVLKLFATSFSYFTTVFSAAFAKDCNTTISDSFSKNSLHIIRNYLSFKVFYSRMKSQQKTITFLFSIKKIKILQTFWFFLSEEKTNSRSQKEATEKVLHNFFIIEKNI